MMSCADLLFAKPDNDCAGSFGNAEDDVCVKAAVECLGNLEVDEFRMMDALREVVRIVIMFGIQIFAHQMLQGLFVVEDPICYIGSKPTVR